ncbi:hypothetical protein DPEC_G00272400 [Dallia pectoralis]|uniref:Uncharacterized protein n=1 Tax=Dallia pectoralis TaxID=75939 RepID=A0ACC2FPZ5_DALPE|nr:hypothetical protein DPEC_G00272400 [Dallia pectoralis]
MHHYAAEVLKIEAGVFAARVAGTRERERDNVSVPTRQNDGKPHPGDAGIANRCSTLPPHGVILSDTRPGRCTCSCRLCQPCQASPGQPRNT